MHFLFCYLHFTRDSPFGHLGFKKATPYILFHFLFYSLIPVQRYVTFEIILFFKFYCEFKKTKTSEKPSIL